MKRMSMSEPERPDDERSERTTVTLPRSMARKLRLAAERERTSVSAIVREALASFLEGMPAPELPSFTGAGRSGRGDLAERAEELIAEGLGEQPTG